MFDVFISDVINVTECWDHSVGVGTQISMSLCSPLIGHLVSSWLLIGQSSSHSEAQEVFFMEM